MTIWDHFIGQEKIISLLQFAINNSDKLAQSWLFIGHEEKTRIDLAQAFAMALECSKHGDNTCSICHEIQTKSFPDVMTLSTDNVIIPIDEVRDFISQSEQMPVIGPWRIMIITDISRMSERSSNVLLKAIEEPTPHTLWILCTSSLQNVLPTIRSRVRTIHCAIPTEEEITDYLLTECTDDQNAQQSTLRRSYAAQAARLAQGDINRALVYFTQRNVLLDREQLINRVLALKNTSGAVVLARDMVNKAQEYGQSESDASVKKQQKLFLTVHGYDAEAVTLSQLDSETRAQYNRIGSSAERKRLTTRFIRDVLDQMIADIESIYRDVAVIQARANSSITLINKEQEEELTNLSVALSQQDVLRKVQFITVARDRLHGNGMLPLIIEALLCSLTSL